MRYALLAIGAIALGASAARAQDPVQVDPAHYKVEVETDQVRVLRVTLGPHDKVPMQSSPPAVVVVLTDGKLKLTPQEGETQELDLKKGQVVSRPEPATFALDNMTDKPYESIRIELKGQAAGGGGPQ
jgi:quercetin dioxygenase-like cupin family protein